MVFITQFHSSGHKSLCKPGDKCKSNTNKSHIFQVHSHNVNGFFYRNCSYLLLEKKKSSDREKLLKFKAEGREFAKILRSL